MTNMVDKKISQAQERLRQAQQDVSTVVQKIITDETDKTQRSAQKIDSLAEEAKKSFVRPSVQTEKRLQELEKNAAEVRAKFTRTPSTAPKKEETTSPATTGLVSTITNGVTNLVGNVVGSVWGWLGSTPEKPKS